MSLGDVVDTLDLAPTPDSPHKDMGDDNPTNLRQALHKREREVVLEALRDSGGVRKEAARLLGIDQRNLSYYIRKHGIDAEQLTASESS
jgi:transcriptional regulator with GAF, ATPase, and Fis domain